MIHNRINCELYCQYFKNPFPAIFRSIARVSSTDCPLHAPIQCIYYTAFLYFDRNGSDLFLYRGEKAADLMPGGFKWEEKPAYSWISISSPLPEVFSFWLAFNCSTCPGVRIFFSNSKLALTVSLMRCFFSSPISWLICSNFF
jgi:hypothetical protein